MVLDRIHLERERMEATREQLMKYMHTLQSVGAEPVAISLMRALFQYFDA